MRSVVGITALSMSLAGCAAGGPESTAAPPQSQCDDSKLGGFVGQTVSAQLGARMLSASGAKILRWGPPRSAMTMDFRPDRLTVSYDDGMIVTSTRCG
jgi:hypothetical protein